jgi:uncharacterized protein (DUF2132 family)
MNDEINYKNNPLHSLSLKNLLIEIVDHYGFEILFAYINMNCFKTNPNIASCVKFLKKTDWACEKVEAFYLYEYKNLPKASTEQFLLPPRDRVIPEDQAPAEPSELSLDDAQRLREKRAEKAAAYAQAQGAGHHRPSSGESYSAQRTRYSGPRDNNRSRSGDHESLGSPASPAEEDVDPWANSRNKLKH